MTDWFIKDGDFFPFVAKLIAAKKVIGPKAKKTEFVFDELETPQDLRLDYDSTILPPKKVFFPTHQRLLEFAEGEVKSCIQPIEKILFGVHFYDVKAIDQLDQIFGENHRDNNYLANRGHTTIVASNIQNVSTRAFFATVGAHVQPKGHDAFLTKIQGGYVFQVITGKGEALMQWGTFFPATRAQMRQAKNENEKVLKHCPEALNHDADTIAARVRASFANKPLWEEMSRQCFSCGICNIVCPTCYCFDVEDTWNLDQVSGFRYRTWDGCQLHDFAKISLGAGASENFRHHVSERYRHRMMRKATYLNPTLGGPACVGCGRCSLGCVPDIADPVKIIQRIMETR